MWSIYQTCIDLSIYQTLSRAEDHQVIKIKITIFILMTQQICFQFIPGLSKKLQKTFPERVAKNFSDKKVAGNFIKKSWRNLHQKLENKLASRTRECCGAREANLWDHQIQSINRLADQSIDGLIHPSFKSINGLNVTTSYRKGLGVLKHRKACLLKY